ncbi:MAG TPA: hypothetical protein VJU18_17050 [Vicinamibacteria bacterium]|nr:hypothetical protein [Vicinamibacteria bacterium]
MRHDTWGLAYLAAAVVGGVWLGSCGGSSSPSQPSTTTLPSTLATTTTTTTTLPPTASACPLGKGDVYAQCSKKSPALLSAVEAAEDALVRARPDIFNLNDVNAGGGYRVLKNDDYFNGVVTNLRTAGFCAERSIFDTIRIKNSNDFSEEYDVLLSTGHMYRGVGSYQKSCYPAAFPLEATDVIVKVPIFLFGYQCPDGKSGPEEFSERKIPAGCTGLVTATPKDKDGKDVPVQIHGTDILWSLHFGDEFVKIEDFPDVPFNKKIVAKEVGEFALCAVVQGIEGCFVGNVIP